MSNIKIKDVLKIIKDKGVICLLIFSFPPLAFVGYSYWVPNVFKSKSVLEFKLEKNQGSNLSGLVGQFGGMASLAGIDLGGDNNRLLVILEVLQSRDFIFRVINKYDLKPKLLGVKYWNQKTEKLVYDNSIYNHKTNTWNTYNNRGIIGEPTDEETYQYFLDNNFKITRDKESGLITLSTYHYSPNIAQRINQIIVDEINIEISKRDSNELKSKIENLEALLINNKSQSLKSIMYQIIETSHQQMALAKMQSQYVFKYIETPKIAEKRFLPNRKVYLGIGMFFGLVFVSIFIFNKIRVH